MRKLAIALFILCLPQGAYSQVWHVEPCPQERRSAYEATRDRLVELEPADRGYRPNPFPVTKDEVVENFLTYHRRAYSDVPFDELRPDHRRFFETVDSGNARYVMRRVANWTPTRCKEAERQSFYHLVQVIDARTGTEITRFAVDEEGDVVGLISRYEDPDPENDLEAIPGLTTVTKGVMSREIPVTPGSPQYVAAWGSVDCPIFVPCIAFRSRGGTYLLGEGELYRLETGRGLMRISRRMSTPERKQSFLRSLEEGDERFMSLGGDHLAYIRPVP